MFILSIRFYLSIVPFYLLRTLIAKQWCDSDIEVGLFNAYNINKSYLSFFYIFIHIELRKQSIFFHVLQEWEERLRFFTPITCPSCSFNPLLPVAPQSLQRSWPLHVLTQWSPEDGGTVLSSCVPPQQPPRLSCLSSLGHGKEVEKQSEAWWLIKLCQF